VYIVTKNTTKGVMELENNEKIRDLIKLLNMNQDHLCYELTSLAAKINNFLDDRTRMLSGLLLSVMYDSLMEENTNESFEIDVNKPVEMGRYKIAGIDADETVETDTVDVLDKAGLAFDESHFALV
jgi:hypothetical protein